MGYAALHACKAARGRYPISVSTTCWQAADALAAPGASSGFQSLENPVNAAAIWL